jgi:hypothetical protein
MNTVDSMENFLSDIIQGRWESVLPQVAGLQLPQDKLLGKEAQAETHRDELLVYDGAGAEDARCSYMEYLCGLSPSKVPVP